MSLDELFHRFRQKDRQALTRLLTLVSRGEELQAIRRALTASLALRVGRAGTPTRSASEGASRVVAITGSAGVGKSTLIGKLIDLIRTKGRSVAVLACDPQSPLTGGALLGDRFRMPHRPDDAGVFIRSLATAGGHGAVAENLDLMIQLLQAFGFDWILLETVGAGQGDTAVHDLADLVVLLLQPEAGDDIQWEKAGLLEIADIAVIHKADLPGADRVEAQVRSLLNLPGCREVPVLRVSAGKNAGLEELLHLIETRAGEKREGAPRGSSRRPVDGQALLELAQEQLADRFRQQHRLVLPILERWEHRQIDDVQAAQEILRALAGEK
jgi:LAO/AO transport system ATPase